MDAPNIFTMSFAKIYSLCVAKAERKGRAKNNVDELGKEMSKIIKA